MQEELRRELRELCHSIRITDIRFSFPRNAFESTAIYLFDYEGEIGSVTRSDIVLLLKPTFRKYGIYGNVAFSDSSAKRWERYGLEAPKYPKESEGIFEDRPEKMPHTQLIRSSVATTASRSHF